MKKTFQTLSLGNKKFNFIALPETNYFKIIISSPMGSNIERVYKQITGNTVYGVAHLIEHLAFKSTHDFTTDELTKIGKNKGSHNAGTAYDLIDYMFKTSMEHMDLAINVVFNIAYNDLSKLTQEEFEMEKMVVANEIRRYMDDDQTMFLCNSNLAACGYEEGDNVLGLPSIIEAITLEDVQAIKSILLSNDAITFNVMYDPCKASQEMIVEKILQEEKRFQAALPKIPITQEAYVKALRYPRLENISMENESEQAMTTLIFEVNENVLLSEIVGKYFEAYAEETCLDDVIRQKNGLTYGIEFFIDTLSHKPYQFFSCDVTMGDEEKLMELFKQSINETVAHFNLVRHKEFIDAISLKRTLHNINLEGLEGLFMVERMDPNALKPIESILSEDIDQAYAVIYEQYASYENMLAAMLRFQEVVNQGKYTRITNVF